MSKDVLFNDEMKQKLFKGIKLASDAASSTLGPAGRTTIIEQGYGSPLMTKDGITVLKNIELEDATENLGVKLVTDASNTANTSAGDGSTTTALLTEAIIEEGLKAINVGTNPIHLKKGMEYATSYITEAIKGYSKPVETKDQIKSAATVSANNDDEMGALISDAIEKVGSDGVITITESKTPETSITMVEGMSFDRGYISSYFCTDHDNLKVEYDEPYILMYDKKISTFNSLLPTLEMVQRTGKPLVIIAEDLENEPLTALVVNSLRGVMQVAAVKAPGFGDRRKAMLEDIAILTGGDLIDEEKGMSLENVTLDNLGVAKSVKIDKESTTIVDGFGAPEEIESRVNQIKKEIAEATSDYDKEKHQERLAKLAGGVAVINVGAQTEAELKEKKFRLEDSLNATRAAITEGIIPGGGATLAHISHESRKSEAIDTKDWNADMLRGFDIVLKAVEKPLKQIVENAGISGDVVLNHVQDSEKNVGYNVLTKEYVDMFTAGIVDPAKVTRCALENAISVATLVLTSNVAITTKREDKNPQMQGMTPMM